MITLSILLEGANISNISIDWVLAKVQATDNGCTIHLYKNNITIGK
jgi:hypothetical protein